MRKRVAGILLAAGGGSRLGRPKAWVEFGGRTLAERGVALLRDGGADPVLVVIGAVPALVEGARAVPNRDWRTGMGSSLRAALRALSEPTPVGWPWADEQEEPPYEDTYSQTGAAVIALVDQPLIGAASVRRLIAAYRAGASVAVAAYDGKPRNPVLIAREHWPAVMASATGDTGARPFLRANPDLVTVIECGDTGSPDDIDTEEDLARINEASANTRSE
ncbi:MAG: nucleotidyltransferase family protein [Nocardiopsaceae bacterium]|nr:nucleotidyltransferase family protein [Nocardiopsaceae bacterium]